MSAAEVEPVLVGSGGLPEGGISAQCRVEMREILARYPQSRSALLPMLHLVQSYEGFVTQAGIEACAQELGITEAEVSGVATFYTMYKRHPMGDYHVGVCTNTLCAVMGGDAIWTLLTQRLGIGHDEVSADGRISLEHVECNAACDYAPVVMVNWEFFDDQTPESAVELVEQLRSAEPVQATRGPRVCTFREAERVLAGFPDGLAHEGVPAGEASLAGLRIHRGDQPADATPGWGRLDAAEDGVDGVDGVDDETPDPSTSAEERA